MEKKRKNGAKVVQFHSMMTQHQLYKNWLGMKVLLMSSGTAYVTIVSNTRPAANKRPGWVLEGLYEHFLFATGVILRDRVVTGGEGRQPSMRGQQHKGIKRCVFIEVTSTLAARQSSHLVLDLGRKEQSNGNVSPGESGGNSGKGAQW